MNAKSFKQAIFLKGLHKGAAWQRPKNSRPALTATKRKRLPTLPALTDDDARRFVEGVR